jgi:hypothetical protein
MCKACAKGLCHQCIVDLGHGLSCKGEHEATVQLYNDMLKRNQRIIAAAPRNILVAPIFYAFMGAVFIAWGLTSPRGMLDFTVILGVGFLIFALVSYRQARKAISRRA